MAQTSAGRLAGRVAVVTGAARGIGAAVARSMAREGARLVLADVDDEGLRALRGELGAADAAFAGIAVRTDVTSSRSVEEMARDCIKSFGRMDILVCAAGVLSAAPVLGMSEEEFDRVLAVNLKGVFLCCRTAARIMADQGSGSIINLSSGSGKRGVALQAHYCASKFGVIGFSQSLALEVGARGVRVNCLCPGLVDTEMLRSFIEQTAVVSGSSPEASWEAWRAQVPLGRVASASEVADVAVFLASDEAAYVTAQAINVCGGLVLH